MQERLKFLFYTLGRCFSTWGSQAAKAVSVLGNEMGAEVLPSCEAKIFCPHQRAK